MRKNFVCVCVCLSTCLTRKNSFRERATKSAAAILLSRNTLVLRYFICNVMFAYKCIVDLLLICGFSSYCMIYNCSLIVLLETIVVKEVARVP